MKPLFNISHSRISPDIAPEIAPDPLARLTRALAALILAAFAIFALAAFAACQPDKSALSAGSNTDAGSASSPATSQTYFPISIGGQELQLQIALNSPEQQKGLMYRDSLDEDHGMLFLFERPDKRSFWMRNTRIPLDIGYFDRTGQLLEIYKLFPYDETPVASKSDRILIAVETNRGWYAAHGVTPGDRINIDELRAALKRRNHTNASLQP